MAPPTLVGLGERELRLRTDGGEGRAQFVSGGVGETALGLQQFGAQFPFGGFAVPHPVDLETELTQARAEAIA